MWGQGPREVDDHLLDQLRIEVDQDVAASDEIEWAACCGGEVTGQVLARETDDLA